MADLETSVVVNLAGDLARKVPTYTNALGRFSASGRRHLGALSRVTSATARGIDRLGNRYTALATGALGAATGGALIRLESRMTRLGIQADISAEKIHELTTEIFAAAQAPDIRIDPSQLTAAIEEIVEKTGDLEFAQNNIRNIAAAISATGAEGAAIGGIAAEFQKMGIVARTDVAEAFDILTVQGKAGAFTLENLSRLGPRVVTSYTAMNRTGVPAIREMGAALQVIRQGTGSAEQAATAFERLLAVISDPEKRKVLEGAGIQLFDLEELKQGREVLRPINELLVEIVTVAQGRKSVLQSVFGDEAGRAFNAILAEFNRTGTISSIQAFYDVQADGSTIMSDAARAAETSEAQIRALRTAWMQFAASNFAEPLTDAFDVLNEIDPDALQSLIGKLVAGGAALAAVSTGAKVFRLARGAGRMIGGKRGGALAGAVAGAGQGMPVFVTNWPGTQSVAGGGANTGGRTRAGRKTVRGVRGTARLLKAAPNLRSIAALGPAALGIAGATTVAAGGAGAAVGTGIDQVLQRTETGLNVRDTIGETIATVLAKLGNDTAQAALAAEERGRVNGAIEIKVTTDPGTRTRVEGLRSENIDLDIDNGGALVLP